MSTDTSYTAWHMVGYVTRWDLMIQYFNDGIADFVRALRMPLEARVAATQLSGVTS